MFARILAAIGAALFLLASPASADCAGAAAVCTQQSAGDAVLIENGHPAAIYADAHDFSGVLDAARNLQSDIGQVSGAPARLSTTRAPCGAVIIVGTIGHSAVIDRLIRAHKLDVSGVTGAWEAYAQQVVANPMPGVASALVIAGADKRGTIFGIYDLSAHIGVSPWTWWADAPVQHHADLYVTAGRNADHPRVKYRGIFINDEDPSLLGWANEHFGGFNHRFYQHVYELILRLKGNYLWPAMWKPKSLFEDDPQSAALANEMGVVLGTSHHEPMMRAHEDWEHHHAGTPWDYTQSAQQLQQFWREGIERTQGQERIVTVGMRGDGDEAMTQGTAIPLLERIVHDQREIIEDVTHRPASETPQLWALYKEVQDYYDQGMRVPDDVTLLFSDDNWGNIRRLPDLHAAPRAGGYGIYYHFDYVGGPRNYKWINTNQIERTWEQMHLAYAYGVDRIWIVNVGDIKPMEYPISFFLDYAWNPDACDLTCLSAYPERWSAQQFGPAHAREIGELLTRYTQYNARRKPELIDPSTFSLINYHEADRVVTDWQALAARAQAIGAQLPAADQDAYFQLVLHPILASANLNAMYVAAARNRLYAAQRRTSAAAWGEDVRTLFARDGEISRQYNTLGHGRWRHLMDQTHIGYTSWQQPDHDIIPEVQAIAVNTPAGIGVAIEGDTRAWPGASGPAVLPELSSYGAAQRTFEVFARGQGRSLSDVSVTSGRSWLGVVRQGEAHGDLTYAVSVDWSAAPHSRTRVPITIRAPSAPPITVFVNVVPPSPQIFGAVEADGVVAVEAARARVVNGGGVTWQEIPHLGRTLSGMTAFPVTAPAQTPGGADARLEFPVTLLAGGQTQVRVEMAPSLAFNGTGLRYAVSIDDETPRIVNVHLGANGHVAHSGEHDDAWESWVANDIIASTTAHAIRAAGQHVVKIWTVDPGLVFERVIVSRGPLPGSYLGPLESEDYITVTGAPRRAAARG